MSLLSAAVEREQLGAERLVVTKYSIVVTRQEPQVAAELVRHSRILPRLRVLPRKTSFQRFQQDIFHIHTYEKSLGICKLETVLYILCV